MCSVAVSHKQLVKKFMRCRSKFSKSKSEKVGAVTGTFYDLLLQIQNRQNSSNAAASVSIERSIIRDTLTVSTIASRSTTTADLCSTERYRETPQTTDHLRTSIKEIKNTSWGRAPPVFHLLRAARELTNSKTNTSARSLITALAGGTGAKVCTRL